MDSPTAPATAAPERPALHLRPAAIAAVTAGGVLGAAARDAIEQAWPTGVRDFPLATFLINGSGALALGALLEALVRRGDDQGRRRLLRLVGGTGFCGAFTTYSTMSVEAVQLGRHHAAGMAALYLLASLATGLAATALGIAAAAGHHRATIGRLPTDPDPDADADRQPDRTRR